MREVQKPWLTITLVVIALAFVACENPFVYSAYEADVEEKYRATTEKNLSRIDSLNAGDSRPFKIALISDSHYHYDDLHDALTSINNKPDIEFIVITGDIAESGLLNDFIYFHKVMSHSKKPYVTVIGNHDYLSNGGLIYRDMFGDYNYSFVFNNVKFILFDNIFWESKKTPDFEWLKAELNDGKKYDHIIPFSHIPPFDKQFAGHRELYHQLLKSRNISLSIHGHRHDFFIGDLYSDGVDYLTIGSPQKRSYCELTVTPKELSIHKIDF